MATVWLSEGDWNVTVIQYFCTLSDEQSSVPRWLLSLVFIGDSLREGQGVSALTNACAAGSQPEKSAFHGQTAAKREKRRNKRAKIPFSSFSPL